MTFSEREASADQGNKVFTYTWQRGSRFWRYATTQEDVELSGQTYLAARGISHGDIEQGTEPVRASIVVTVPIDNPVAGEFVSYAPYDSIVLTIGEYHVGEEADRHLVWTGRIIGSELNVPDATAAITHEPTYTSIKRTGLRRTYGINCQLQLYGARCGVNREDFVRTMTAETVTGVVVVSTLFQTENVGHWPGGFIVYQVAGAVTDRRFIRSCSGKAAVLDAPPIGLAVDASFRAYPGCDHHIDTCIDFFHNGDNNGGFPFFGTTNPFDGTKVY